MGLAPPIRYNTSGHWWALKLMYIKLPMYRFFYMALGLNDFESSSLSMAFVSDIALMSDYYFPRHLNIYNHLLGSHDAE
jgi:hypothetical protein